LQNSQPVIDYSETTAHAPDESHAYRTFACKHCGAVHAYVALSRCSDRTCTQCRKKDFYRLLRAYKPFVAGLQAHDVRLVTLTLKNTTVLEGTVDRLRKAWKKLVRRQPYRTIWRGGAYAIECVNKGQGWHVHLHVLVEGSYVVQQQLVQDWLALTGDSYIVDLRPCTHPEGALRYILKYLLKAPTVEEGREEYNAVLKGKRLIQAWGSWYGQQTPDEEEPKLVCAGCGQSAWIVIIRPLDQPPADPQAYQAYRKLMRFADIEVRAG
jgi:Replication protein